MLSKRIMHVSGSLTSGMRNKAKQLKEQGIPVINFAAGELDFDTSDAIKLAAKKAIDDGYSKYTDTHGIKTLRELVAKNIFEETGAVYSSEEICITAGAKHALYNTAVALFEPGDEIIIPSPYWVTYPAQVQIMDAKPIFLDTTPSQYQIDIAKLSELISSRTKAIIINTPNNPTGVIYDVERLEKIADLAIKHDFWIIFDECYSGIVYKPYSHFNVVSLSEKVKQKTIVINSFSKSCAVTGWRVGYMCAPKIVADAIKNLQSHMTSNICNIAQYGMLAACGEEHKKFSAQVNEILYDRLQVALKIIDSMDGISYVMPQGAFYIFLNVKEKLNKSHKGKNITDTDRMAELLLEEVQVAVVAGTAFGESECLRISYALSLDDITEGLSRMKKFFENLI